VTVDITVNWTFIGEDDDVAQVSFGTRRLADRKGHEAQDEGEESENVFSEVLPLNSSVLARGLSLPLPI